MFANNPNGSLDKSLATGYGLRTPWDQQVHTSSSKLDHNLQLETSLMAKMTM